MSRAVTMPCLAIAACLALFGCNSVGGKAERRARLGTNANADTVGKGSLKRTDRSERELCLETASAVAAEGHAQEAIKLLEKAEQLAPNQPPLDLQLAPLYARAGQFDASIERYQRAIVQGNAGADAHTNLAWTFMEAGRLPEAQHVVQQGLAQWSHDERLRSTQAVVWYRIGRRMEALNAFRSMYGDAAAHHNMAILELEHGFPNLAYEQAQIATRCPNCPSESIALRDQLHLQLAKSHTPTMR